MRRLLRQILVVAQAIFNVFEDVAETTHLDTSRPLGSGVWWMLMVADVEVLLDAVNAVGQAQIVALAAGVGVDEFAH